MANITTLLRYPGGKQRMLSFLASHLPRTKDIKGKFIEPFIGGGAVYFYSRPHRALLSDLNGELITLYKALRKNPERVWRIYRSYPTTKRGYRQVRDVDIANLSPLQRAARLLFLNRTCFKGMWRHNRQGKFNIGYGGQSRRWCLTRKDLVLAGHTLKRAKLVCSDFEPIIEAATALDFLFLDPPYRPGEREQLNDHYVGKRFSFADHRRLAESLVDADRRGVKWALTISGHSDIVRLYDGFAIVPIPRGTGRKIGAFVRNPGEVLITNVSRSL